MQSISHTTGLQPELAQLLLGDVFGGGYGLSLRLKSSDLKETVVDAHTEPTETQEP